MLVNPITLDKLDKYIEKPFQTLLLVGPKGSGKYTAVKYLINRLTDDDFDSYPYKILIDGNTDGIDSIRDVKKEFSHVFVSKNTSDRRFVVINNIDKISRESIPSMLKIVEEPPEQTLIIMCSDQLSKVPTTILSRAQKIDVLPISKDLASQYLKNNGYNETDSEKIWLKTSGLAAKIMSSADNNDDEYIVLAKEFIMKKAYDRLILVNEYSKFDKNKQSMIIDAISAIIDYKIGFSANDLSDAKDMADKLNKLNASKTMLEANVNPKLIWTELSLSL